MSIANKYNRGLTFFDYEIPETHEYKSMADLYNNNGADYVYNLKRLLINQKSKFGDSPILVTDNEMVNAPKHLLDVVNEMRKDVEFVEAINQGKMGFKIYTYTTNNRPCYSVNWVDIA